MSDDSPDDHAKFLAYLKRVRAEVATWPEWQRNVLGRWVEVPPEEPKPKGEPAIMALKVTCEVDTLEVDGSQRRADGCSHGRIKVLSHFEEGDYVVLEIGRTQYTFKATDLQQAIGMAARGK